MHEDGSHAMCDAMRKANLVTLLSYRHAHINTPTKTNTYIFVLTVYFVNMVMRKPRRSAWVLVMTVTTALHLTLSIVYFVFMLRDNQKAAKNDSVHLT